VISAGPQFGESAYLASDIPVLFDELGRAFQLDFHAFGIA